MSYQIGDETFPCPQCDREFPQPVPEEGCKACRLGNEPCSFHAVRDYIAAEYNLTRDTASDLARKHEQLINEGQRMGSRTYYVGDRIVKADGG